MPVMDSQWVLSSEKSNFGKAAKCQYWSPIQELKHTGIAVISSSTTEHGSFLPSSFSAKPQSHTEINNPKMAAKRKLQSLPVARSRANQTKPTTEPKVPGAHGIRPTPKPCAIQSLTCRPDK